MAIGYITSAQANSASSQVSSEAFTVPVGAVAGTACFLLFQSYSGGGGASTLTVTSTASTWTQLGTTQYVAGTSSQSNGALFYLEAGASDASSTVTCHSSVSNFINVTAVFYSGAAVSFIDVSAVTSSATLSSTAPMPTTNTVQANDWALYFAVICNGGAGYSAPSLTGGTNRFANIGSDSGIAAAGDSNGSVGGAGTTIGTGVHYTPSTTGDYITWVVGLAPPASSVFYSTPALVPPGFQSPAAWGQQLPPPSPPAPAQIIAAAPSTLSGSGSMSATGAIVIPGAASLAGTGTMTATGTATGANLAGTGTMTATAVETFDFFTAMAGSGVMSAAFTGTFLQSAGLAGQGQLGLNLTLKLFDGLFGTGSLSIPQVAGGLVNGVGGVGFPYALPGSSQVAVAPPGSTAWQWLGTLGQVTALTYSYVCPGGCDKMSCTIMVPAAYRTQLFNPGWKVKIVRGGHDIWHGKLDEPVPTASGWTLTAVGQGNRGQDFLAIYSSTWPGSEPDQPVNNAISRGLPWVNPGVGSPSGAWYGQAVDSGAQTITALLNLICTRGGLTWYVNSQPGGALGDSLSVFALPTTVNRLLVVTTPVARTLGGDINTIFIRYESAADNATTGAAATYATTSVQNAQSVAAHQVIETYIDLSDVGVQTAGQAQAVGNAVLQIYQRASFAGPFTASFGQLLNTGGASIDPGTDQAGTVVRLILTDFGYGGEVTPQFPITFIVGAYEWDDFAQVATITPYQNLDQSLTGLLSAQNTVLTPIATASS